jgi:hypothetical protein
MKIFTLEMSKPYLPVLVFRSRNADPSWSLCLINHLGIESGPSHEGHGEPLFEFRSVNVFARKTMCSIRAGLRIPAPTLAHLRPS